MQLSNRDVSIRLRIYGYQGSSSRVQNCFDLEIDVHPVTDNNAAGFEDSVKVHPEIAALEFTDRREPGASAPERIGTETPELEPQRNRLRNGLQGQLPVDHVILTVAAHAGRPERHRFVRVDLEEVSRAEGVVAILVARIHRAEIDRCRDARVKWRVACHEVTAEDPEPAS